MPISEMEDYFENPYLPFTAYLMNHVFQTFVQS